MSLLCSNLCSVSESPIQKPKSLQLHPLWAPQLLPINFITYFPLLLMSLQYPCFLADAEYFRHTPPVFVNEWASMRNNCNFSSGEGKLRIWTNDLPIRNFLLSVHEVNGQDTVWWAGSAIWGEQPVKVSQSPGGKTWPCPWQGKMPLKGTVPSMLPLCTFISHDSSKFQHVSDVQKLVHDVREFSPATKKCFGLLKTWNH